MSGFPTAPTPDSLLRKRVCLLCNASSQRGELGFFPELWNWGSKTSGKIEGYWPLSGRVCVGEGEAGAPDSWGWTCGSCGLRALKWGL